MLGIEQVNKKVIHYLGTFNFTLVVDNPYSVGVAIIACTNISAQRMLPVK